MNTQAFAARSLALFLFAALALCPLQARAQDTTQAAGAEAAHVQTAEQEPYGTFLTDAEGKSLYLFLADTTQASTCYDACAEAWPPLLTGGEPMADEQADASLLGTTPREDGSTQVTYGGHPLYYFAGDQQPGDTEGQDIEGYGAEWYLVSPEGEKAEGE